MVIKTSTPKKGVVVGSTLTLVSVDPTASVRLYKIKEGTVIAVDCKTQREQTYRLRSTICSFKDL